jgi:hypothetical protein
MAPIFLKAWQKHPRWLVVVKFMSFLVGCSVAMVTIIDHFISGWVGVALSRYAVASGAILLIVAAALYVRAGLLQETCLSWQTAMGILFTLLAFLWLVLIDRLYYRHFRSDFVVASFCTEGVAIILALWMWSSLKSWRKIAPLIWIIFLTAAIFVEFRSFIWYAPDDLQDPGEVAMAFTQSLAHNNREMTKSLVIPEKWGLVDGWISNHKDFDCTFFQIETWAEGGMSYTGELTEWKAYYRCDRSAIKVEAITFRQTEDGYLIADWKVHSGHTP